MTPQKHPRQGRHRPRRPAHGATSGGRHGAQRPPDVPRRERRPAELTREDHRREAQGLHETHPGHATDFGELADEFTAHDLLGLRRLRQGTRRGGQRGI